MKNIFERYFDFNLMVGTIFNCAGELSGNDKQGYSLHYGLKTDKEIYGFVFKNINGNYIAVVQDLTTKDNPIITIRFKHFETLCKKLQFKFA